MKRRILTTALLLLIIVVLAGCTAKPTGQLNTAREEIQLPDGSDFAALLSQRDSVCLEIRMFNGTFAVENPDGLGFAVEQGSIKENAIGAEEAGASVEKTVSVDYLVPFATAYKLFYAEPQEDCNFKLSWSDGEVFARARGSGIQTVECSLSGIRLTGADMEYTLKFYIPNDDNTILKITGSGESNVSLVRTEDGFRFYCENGAHMELPDWDEINAVRELEIPAGTVGVLEHASKGYEAELSTEPFPD